MPGLDALARVIRPAAGAPEAALVLMHGCGTSEQDLYRESPVGHFIDPHVVPEPTTWVQERRASAPLP